MKRAYKTKTQKAFAQGFLCAACIMIKFEGGISTPIKELLQAGGYKLSELSAYEIDEYDVEILNQHKKDIS